MSDEDDAAAATADDANADDDDDADAGDDDDDDDDVDADDDDDYEDGCDLGGGQCNHESDAKAIFRFRSEDLPLSHSSHHHKGSNK